MRIFGHPVHMMLIHFPAALLPMDLFCSIVGYFTDDPSFTTAAYFAMAGGVALGTLAIVTGAIDLIGIADNKPLSLKKTLIHGGINATVIIAYSIFAFRAYKTFPDLIPDDVVILIIKGALITFMMFGNYLGGSLILKDRIGLQNN